MFDHFIFTKVYYLGCLVCGSISSPVHRPGKLKKQPSRIRKLKSATHFCTQPLGDRAECILNSTWLLGYLPDSWYTTAQLIGIRIEWFMECFVEKLWRGLREWSTFWFIDSHWIWIVNIFFIKKRCIFRLNILQKQQ